MLVKLVHVTGGSIFFIVLPTHSSFTHGARIEVKCMVVYFLKYNFLFNVERYFYMTLLNCLSSFSASMYLLYELLNQLKVFVLLINISISHFCIVHYVLT